MSKDKCVEFGCFDPSAEVEVRSGDLPHWLQIGAAMFVTFRTIDSMPREVLERRRRELLDSLRRFGVQESLADRAVELEKVDHSLISHLPLKTRLEFRQRCDRLWHQALDECHGKCLLKDPDLAKIAGDAIRHFDGVKYDLDRIVIMPNHVHVIVQFRAGSTLDVVGQSWLRYSARRINAVTGEKGHFWQGEPFDHLIRSEEQFRYLQQYIADNPAKTNLDSSETLFWKRQL